MKMTFRWFGSKDDTITLAQLRQIPGLSGVVGTVSDIPAGEVWPKERIAALKKEVNDAGLEIEVIESVNIHDSIKTGSPGRGRCIENYKKTIRNLSEYGIKVICYNFMPVFDWVRTSLYRRLEDGSVVSAFSQAEADRLDVDGIIQMFMEDAQKHSLPGWEPERIARTGELIHAYKEVSEDDMVANLKYFLERIIPVCEECGISMAIHPDDPPWDLFGLPRIARNAADLDRILGLVDSPRNGLTLCCGALGAGTQNDLPAMIRRFAGRVHFTHVRNVKITSATDFYETAHPSPCGSLDLYEIMKALHDTNFAGYIRPDHGRMIWGEEGRPGYGLFDRALGIAYLNGLWEAISKSAKPRS
jgi:mannonate dehydratase